MFSCEFCEISKNIFFIEYLWATTSIIWEEKSGESSNHHYASRLKQEKPTKQSEAALQRCSWEKVFWIYEQIYRKTPTQKCDFNKVAKQLIEIAVRHECSPINLLHIFRTPFPKNTSGWLLLNSKFSTKIYQTFYLPHLLGFHHSFFPKKQKQMK